MIKTKKTLSLLKFTYCISAIFIIVDADNKKNGD